MTKTCVTGGIVILLNYTNNIKGVLPLQIHESAEDYLEAILMLKERKGAVRSIDIANELEYTKPSVSVAMKKLRENGYVLMDDEGLLTLTPEGEKIIHGGINAIKATA